MKMTAWKTVQSREGRPDEFFISFGKQGHLPRNSPFFLFSCPEAVAREAFGEEIDKINGIGKEHKITFTMSMREEDEQNN